ncbi:MAG: hypothetical protein J6M07_09745, partial [Ruminococcus sp.]|nr:hypothetical protein [Ruminococcus sp.]
EINKARDIAAANNYIYITDLLYKTAFKAADWMIDGKHDTVIVSVEDMKKKGKPYAPVTPLTNVVLPFKKVMCPFLYSKGTPDAPKVMNKKEIDEMLKKYLTDSLSDFDHPEVIGETEFEIYGSAVKMDKNESRCVAVTKSLELIDKMLVPIEKNADSIKAAGYDLDMREFEISALEIAAEKCGIPHDPKSYDGITELTALKERFIKNVSEKNSYGFKFTEPDKEKFTNALRAIESSPADTETLKKDILPLLSVRPVLPAVFNLARALSPADAENVENISEYWGVESLSIKELSDYLADYVPADARDADGKINCAPAKAKVILEELEKAADKYKLRNFAAVDEIKAYIDDAEKSLRTYNGTVFDNIEAMNKAQENEKKLMEECDDLSALNKDELVKLRKYIYDLNLDKKTASKYLVKVRLAMNDVEKNEAEKLVFGIQSKSKDELDDIKKKLSEKDEALAAPFVKKVESAALALQLKELTDLFKEIPDNAKADSLEKALASGTYDPMFKRHFSAKIDRARDGFGRAELDKICVGIDSADKKTVADIRSKVEAVKCRDAVKAAYIKKLDARDRAIVEDEVKKLFSVIPTADKAKVEELKKVIADKTYPAALTDGYVKKLDDRLIEIENVAFVKKCETIPQMDKAALDDIVKELGSGKYPKEICDKYMPATEARAKAILKAEIDAICKDIPTMSFEKLEELEKKLGDEKYPEDLTKAGFESIKTRREALYKKEADDLCKNISTLDKKGVEELRKKLEDEKYDRE